MCLFYIFVLESLKRKLINHMIVEIKIMLNTKKSIAITKLHIYGRPGQRRFNFMASIACMGAAGMVVLIDNGHEQPLAELNNFLILAFQIFKI